MSKKIVFCNCGGKIIDTPKLEAIETGISGIELPFIKVSDLCSICSTNKEKAQSLFSSSDEILIVACYPRAVKLLLEFAGVDAVSRPYSFVNFRDTNNENVLSEIKSFTKDDKIDSLSNVINGEAEWPSWFPIIDYSRCSSCGQCADFCLFGVYEKIEDKVVVVNPKSCKNNCPACARICPQTAIVFPKYQQGGAIAGADNIDEIAEQQRQREDIDSIIGGDIYKALEQRKAKRNGIVKTDAMKKAIEERDKALKEKTL